MIYYIDDEFESIDGNGWTKLLMTYLSSADAIEFNILYSSKELDNILSNFESGIIEIGRRKNKIYPSGQFVRFKVSEQIKDFILSKKYHFWNSFCLEDISILKNGMEILATITHENYIYVTGTPEEIEKINSLGFKFDTPFEH
jgi:hypothetical protein